MKKAKMEAPSKKCYSPKSVYWYQCFSVWKMVGAKSLVHGRPNTFAIRWTHIAYAWGKNKTNKQKKPIAPYLWT